MIKTIARLLLGILVFISIQTHAQTDSTHHRRPLTAREKLIPNKIKLELVYREALVTQYNNYGGSRTYSVFQPYVRINDAKPVEIGKQAEFLRSFFSRCNEADEQIDLYNQQMRRARLDWWTGVGVGTGIAFTGLGVVAGSKNPSAATFFGFVIGGAAVMGTGVYLARMHAKKADEHLRLSVDIYNTRCYKPDTTRPQIANNTPPAPVTPTERKIYQDTAMYRLIRNEPSHSGLFGLTLMPANVLVSSLNLGISAGIGAFYTYESKFGVNVSYQQAYADDISGGSRDNIPSGDAESYGIPANYSKSSLLDIQTRTTLASWEKEGYYHLKLGNTKIGGMHAEVIGKTRGIITRAITGRFGYQLDNRLEESSSSGMGYTTSTPVYTYHWQGQDYPLSPTNLATSSTMIKAGIITAGVGYTTFRDMKIELLDDTYSGRREIKSQTDLFLDAMYAQSMTVEDMIYYYALEPMTGEYTHLPQRLTLKPTPVNKMGVRLGIQTLAMYSPHFGWKTVLEVGMRPGPKTVDAQEPFYLQLTWGLIFGGRKSSQD